MTEHLFQLSNCDYNYPYARLNICVKLNQNRFIIAFGPLVLEKKIFEGFLPYMGMATIFIMRPGPLYKVSFLSSKNLSHGIWFQIAQKFFYLENKIEV